MTIRPTIRAPRVLAALLVASAGALSAACSGGEGLAEGPTFQGGADTTVAADAGSDAVLVDVGGDAATADAGPGKCKAHADCPGAGDKPARKYCDADAGACRACTRAAHCAGPNGRCVAGVCKAAVKCISDVKCIAEAGVCLPGANYCVDCLSADDCDKGLRCAGYQCLPPADTCTTSASCAALGQICDKQRGECVDCAVHGDCPAGRHCQDGVCATDVCPKDYDRCAGPAALERCADGSGWTKLPCKAGEVCLTAGKDAKCWPKTCEPGQLTCVGHEVHVCLDTGTGRGKKQDCAASAKVCFKGKCIDAVCAPHTTACADKGNAVVKCAADGQSTTTTACAAATWCEQGVCKKQVCKPTELLCVGDALHVCNTNGTGTKLLDACPKGTDCVGGKCVKLVCQPGQSKCEAGKLFTCSKDATAWEPKACPSGQACVGKACKKVVCLPGQPGCDKFVAYTCAADGQTKNSTTNCQDKGLACAAGKCVKPACNPGARKCQGATLNTCAEDALTWTDKSCLDAKPCTRDSCEPGAGKCVNSAISACKSDTAASWHPCQGPAGQAGIYVQDHFVGAALSKAWNTACVGAEPSFALQGSKMTLTNTSLSFCATDKSTSWLCTDADKGNQICRPFAVGQGGFDVRVKLEWSSAQQMMGNFGVAVTAKDGTIVARMGYRDSDSTQGVGGVVELAEGAVKAGFSGLESDAGSAEFLLRREAGKLKGWVNGKQVLDVVNWSAIDRLAIYTVRYKKGAMAYPFFTVGLDSVWACRW